MRNNRWFPRPWLWLVVGVLLGFVAQAQEAITEVAAPEAAAPDATVPDDKAAEATDTPVVVAPVRRYYSDQESWQPALEKQKEKDAVWLESDGERFLVLVQRQRTPDPQGAVLLVADLGDLPDEGLVGNLRRHLPDRGWHTMAMALPPGDWAAMPSRKFPVKGFVPEKAAEKKEAAGEGDKPAEAAADAKDKPADEPVTESKPATESEPAAIDVATDPVAPETPVRPAFALGSQARLAVALKQLQADGFQNIALVGVGRGAGVITRHLLDNRASYAERGLGLIWLDAQLGEDVPLPLDTAFAEGMAWPLLDMVDSRIPNEAARLRKGDVRRGKWEHYRQEILPLLSTPSEVGSNRVTQRVIGWLAANMKGMQGTAFGGDAE